MPAFLVIFPVLSFDIWLLATIGKTQLKTWAADGKWRHILLVTLIGLALAVFLAFFVAYKWGDKMRVTGFPIPDSFSSLGDDGKWSASGSPPVIHLMAIVVNIVSGLAAPFIPFKAAEFLRTVKAELSHAPR